MALCRIFGTYISQRYTTVPRSRQETRIYSGDFENGYGIRDAYARRRLLFFTR